MLGKAIRGNCCSIRARLVFAVFVLSVGSTLVGLACCDDDTGFLSGYTKESEMLGRRPGSKSTTAMLFRADAVPCDSMRYQTVGDWIMSKGPIHVSVARFADRRYEFLVALHELIEARLCQEHGITQATVDDWDMHHQDASEPGEVPGAPYFLEHVFATRIELLVARELGVDWHQYEAAIRGLGK